MLVWRYGKKWQLALYLAISLASSGLNVGIAWILSRFIAAATARNFAMFLASAWLALAIFVGLGVVEWLAMTTNAAIVKTVNLRIKAIMIRYMVDDEPLTTDSGKDISFMTNDLKMLETNGTTNELLILSDALTFIGAMVGAFAFDWVTALAFFAGNMLPVGISALTQKTIGHASEQWSAANASWTGQLKDFLAGLDTARAYQANGAVKSRTGKLAAALEGRLFHMNFIIGTTQAAAMIVSLVLGVLLPFGAGVWRIILGASTVASFIGVVQLSNDMRNPLLEALNAFNKWGATKPITAKVRTAERALSAKTETGEALPGDAATQALAMRNATVTINGKPILQNLSLAIKPGEKVLLMAPSRYGKSTLLRVLQGEIPLANGTYTIGGVPANQVNRVALRKHFGLVKQSPFLFNDTLRYNLTLGAEFSDEAIMTAVAQAGLSDLVADKGLDYQIVENGQNLSGGQIQWIEIARALLRQRPVLLADEATSALDDKLADQVRRQFLAGPETLIEVGHQVPAAVQAQYDRVIHLDQIAGGPETAAAKSAETDEDEPTAVAQPA